MKTIIETIKENKYFIIITILSILTTLFFATTALFISISDDLTNVVQTKDEEINKLNAEISFDAVDYLKYELYKVNNNKPTKLINYSNKSGKITYNDTNLNYGSKYGYYLKISTINDSTQTFSETINILTDSLASNLDKLIIKESDANSWLFR